MIDRLTEDYQYLYEQSAAEQDSDKPDDLMPTMEATKELIAKLYENLEPPTLDHPRVLFQLHVEGTSMHGESHRTLDDPDAMRCDKYWAPLDSIIAADGLPGRQTWSDFCDELQLPDDIRSLYPQDSAVKTWDEVCQESALQPSWGNSGPS